VQHFGRLFYSVLWIVICYIKRSGIDFRWGRDFPPVQTIPGAQSASCTTGTGFFPGVKCGRGVLLTTHPFQCRGYGTVELYLYPPSGLQLACILNTLFFFICYVTPHTNTVTYYYKNKIFAIPCNMLQPVRSSLGANCKNVKRGQLLLILKQNPLLQYPIVITKPYYILLPGLTHTNTNILTQIIPLFIILKHLQIFK